MRTFRRRTARRVAEGAPLAARVDDAATVLVHWVHEMDRDPLLVTGYWLLVNAQLVEQGGRVWVVGVAGIIGEDVAQHAIVLLGDTGHVKGHKPAAVRHSVVARQRPQAQDGGVLFRGVVSRPCSGAPRSPWGLCRPGS